MNELLIVLGTEVTLLLSVAAMKVYRWRTDVLTGPYMWRKRRPAAPGAGTTTKRPDPA
jgi:hypothetical protein